MAPPLAQLGGRYAGIVNDLPAGSGLVDLHTHPVAHLGFGTELFYGPPDGDPAAVFNSCNPYHGGYGLQDNPKGNDIRQQLVDKFAANGYGPPWPSWDHGRQGWPAFAAWPTWHDRLHQQVRVEALERAWQGGLRVLVALAVNSHALAVAAQTSGPHDYKSAGDAQIAELHAFVGRHDFMAIVLTPEDLRRVVAGGQLAVIIGVELDCVGNFYLPVNVDPSDPLYQPDPSDAAIRAEVRRLYDSGVRYVFPVHLLDNFAGGAALYESKFAEANRYEFGAWYQAEPAPVGSYIGYQYDPGGGLDAIVDSVALGFDVTTGRPTPPPSRTGHRNARGLQDRGRVMIDALMELGMLIDVDHMGEKTVADVLAHTSGRRYPVCAGHNGVRKQDGTGNERAHTLDTVVEILGRGGMFGIGIKAGLDFIAGTIAELRRATDAGGIALGSDCSGLEQLPFPRFPERTEQDASARSAAGMVVYRDNSGAPGDALVRCQMGQRTWDLSLEGFAHIGLYPDLLEEGVTSGILNDADFAELFGAPERLAQTWETCLGRRHVDPGHEGDAGMSDVELFAIVPSGAPTSVAYTAWLPDPPPPPPGHATTLPWTLWSSVDDEVAASNRQTIGGPHVIPPHAGGPGPVVLGAPNIPPPGPTVPVTSAAIACARRLCGPAVGDLHLCTVDTTGTLVHTRRRADGYWNRPAQPIVPPVGSTVPSMKMVAAAMVGEELHVCTTGADGRLYHAIAGATGAWPAAYEDVLKAVIGGAFNASGPLTHIACAGLLGELHVLAVTGLPKSQLLYTVRHADGTWDPPSDVIANMVSAGWNLQNAAGLAAPPYLLYGVAATGFRGSLHVCVAIQLMFPDPTGTVATVLHLTFSWRGEWGGRRLDVLGLINQVFRPQSPPPAPLYDPAARLAMASDGRWVHLCYPAGVQAPAVSILHLGCFEGYLWYPPDRVPYPGQEVFRQVALAGSK